MHTQGSRMGKKSLTHRGASGGNALKNLACQKERSSLEAAAVAHVHATVERSKVAIVLLYPNR